ncbi:hypothetical protein LCGC14_1715730 [marine sediment metagenome]|uniref:Uncharacterized protein n=1 Tax=marine sediment metagenome TaxID=412755 RepID=A0A0F9KDV1_9ZZZZ
MAKQQGSTWTKRCWPASTDYVLQGTDLFIVRPLHAAGEMPSGYHYRSYLAGAHDSGCALPLSFFRTLKEAKADTEIRARSLAIGGKP